MPDWNPRANNIFLDALEIAEPEGRLAFLEQACCGDTELWSQVDSLIAASQKAGRFLETPPVDFGIETSDTVDPVPNHQTGSQIGPYRLLEVIGEGGMGTVFLAEQAVPVQRRVALKVIKAGMDTRQAIGRFEAERQTLTLMDHVNIARVLDGGATESGQPYFVMELIDGIPITTYCDENQLTPRQRLELFMPVCRAIQHAHQKGIIHRDIKPSNVLITLYDGHPVPKVIDFGVAKAIEQKLTERTLFTQHGTLVGTLEYMSPEQAESSKLGIDTRSDIYSLGVLLYELLTGNSPLSHHLVRETRYAEILRIIQYDDPPKPSTRLSDSGEALSSISAQRRMEPVKLVKLVRGELDWIVMKALEKDRNRRYESASGFAKDIKCYLADEPVSACPPSAMYRIGKFARRNKLILGTGFVIGLAILTAVAASVRSNLLIAQEQLVTKNALEAETKAKLDLEGTLQRERRDAYFHRIALAHRELDVNNLARALQLLEECPEDLRRWEWHYLMRLCRVEPVILRQKTEVNSIAFSPSGDRLASAGGDGNIQIWNTQTWKVVQSLKNAHGGFVSSIVFHPDGNHLASVGADRQVNVWDLTTGEKLFAQQCDSVHAYGTAYAVAFNALDGQQLAAGNEGAVKIWDWRSGQLLRNLTGHEKRPISLAFSEEGRLASGSWRGSVKLWDVESRGQPLATYGDKGSSHHPVVALAFSQVGRRLATASYDRRVDVWDTTTGERSLTLPQNGLVMCVAYSPDGRRIASSGEDKTVRVWDAETGREVLGLRGHTGNCGCVTFSPDGRWLASASKDGTIRIWDASPLQGDEGQEANFAKDSNEVWAVAVDPDGRKIASGGWSMPVKVRDIASGRVNVEFPGLENIVFDVAWHPDGHRIASAGRSGELFTVKVWDARTGKEIYSLPPGGEYFSAAFSPDGRYLVTGSANLSVQVWDAESGKAVSTLGTHDRVIHGVVFSRDGRHLASVCDEGVVKVWDATRLDAKQTPRLSVQGWIHGQCINIALSPDGSRLATGGKENTVTIWDGETGQALQTLRGHTGDVSTLAFSPDEAGRWIASAGEDTTVNIWNSQTGQMVRSFRGHVGQVSSLAFTPDGRQLVSGSRDHFIKIWDVTELDEAPEP